MADGGGYVAFSAFEGEVDYAALGLRDLLDLNPIVGEPKFGRDRRWSGHELWLIDTGWKSLGLAGLIPKLPGRSAVAIHKQACDRGLAGPHGDASRLTYQRWTTNEHIDAVITRAYQSTPGPRDLARCALAVGRPRRWVSRRAAQMGLVQPRFREPRWSAAELAILHDSEGRPPATIRRALKRAGFTRSETAIVVKLKREGLSSAVEEPDVYSIKALSGFMGVNHHVVARWIDKGWLKAKIVGQASTLKPDGNQWRILRRDVRAFVIDNAAAVDLRKVDKDWFIDLLAHKDGLTT